MQAALRKIQFALLIALVFTMPFSTGEIKLNSYFIILLTVNTILCAIFLKGEAGRSFHPILILFAFVFVAHLTGLFKADNMHGATFELQKKLGILLFPFVLFFSPRFTAKENGKVMLSFVLSCLLTGIVCIATATFRFITTLEPEVFFYHRFSEIAGIHATYLSMYCCFSIAILLYGYFEKINSFTARQKAAYYFSVFILALSVLFLSGRMQILVLVVGAAAYLVFSYYKKIGMVRSLLLAILAGGGILGLALLSPTIRDRFKEGLNYDIGERWGEQQVRALIWSSAIELIKEHPLTGVGTGDVQDELQKYYLDHEYVSLTYLENTRYNAHNQYLETAVGLGMPGLLILLAGFFASLVYARRNNKILYFIFVLLFMLSCMTESMLERQNGIVFYAFFNAFLYLNSFSIRGSDSRVSA